MGRTIAQNAKSLAAHLHDKWSGLNLAAQFALAALVVLTHGMAIFGAWVTHRIEQGMNSFIEPLLQELATTNQLSSEAQRRLDALLAETPLGRKVVAIKVWAPDGTVLFSNNKQLIGRKYPMTDRLSGAWSGQVEAEFNHLEDEENELERPLLLPLLEIYAPVRAARSDRIIAVAEIYEAASHLRQELRWARLQSWYVVGIVTIVLGGSRTIALQQRSLEDRIEELSRLLCQNEDLRRRIDEIHRRSVATNELFLRRVGVELHDGPAQLISLALLRLDVLRPLPSHPDAETATQQFKRIQSALAESLAEIRNISAGLALPELENVTPVTALQLAARNHERRTNTTVKCALGELPSYLPTDIKTCLYRVVQEGLNNAFRHAGGVGQAVRARYFDGIVEIQVMDSGAGFEPSESNFGGNRIGLAGMRDRIASLGGSLQVESARGKGTHLTARFKITNDEFDRSEVAEHV